MAIILDGTNGETFSGTGMRITGDFSNATASNRVLVQTSTSNSNTYFGIIPNGTGTSGRVLLYSGSDSANTSIFSISSDSSDHRLTATLSGTGTYLPMAFYTGGSARVTIDTSGNVGVGTASPKGKLTVLAPSSATLGDEATSAINIIGNNGTGTFWQIGFGAYDTSFTYAPAAIGYVQTTASGYNNGALVFATRAVTTDTAPTERMRVDINGNLAIGTASTTIAGDSGKIMADAGSGLGLLANRTGDGNIVRWYRTNSQVGSINLTAGATAYVTSSDYRLKEDIAPMTGALTKVAALKPVIYKWKADGSDGEGFIAHELAEVVPQCVSGIKDAIKEDGSIDPQGIDTSFLVATLTAAIQEQQAIITAMTARIEALEAK